MYFLYIILSLFSIGGGYYYFFYHTPNEDCHLTEEIDEDNFTEVIYLWDDTF